MPRKTTVVALALLFALGLALLLDEEGDRSPADVFLPQSPGAAGFLADASLAAVFLLALSGVLTWFLVVRRGHAPTRQAGRCPGPAERPPGRAERPPGRAGTGDPAHPRACGQPDPPLPAIGYAPPPGDPARDRVGGG